MQELTRNLVTNDKKWNLFDIINPSQIPTIIQNVNNQLPLFDKFHNNINKDNAIACLELESKISYQVEMLYAYSHMKSDEDKSIAKYQELSDSAIQLYVAFSTATSFINPSLSRLQISELNEMVSSKVYSNFSRYLELIIREKKHILSTKEESLLSGMSSFDGDFGTIFSMFDNVDVDLGSINVRGEEVKITQGGYALLLRDKDQTIRKEAFKTFYKGYISMINTVAATYIGNVKRTCYIAKVRKYKNSLDMALSSNNIPYKVYDNLLESVRKYTPAMHKYISLRKQILGLSEQHIYDIYVPIVAEIDKIVDYEDAYKLVIDGLAPLGEEYKNLLLTAKKNGWIDVEETKAKRSGAYSSGVYGVHPYVLLNHKGTMHDIFTIAHELGHAMHSYYSNSTQCYEKADYTIFVAEIASTVNEVLLIKYMLKTAKGKERMYLLSYYIDMIRTTLFRQTMFAEFEKFAHQMIEDNMPLSGENMTEYYDKLNHTYYGDDIIIDKEVSYEWARIPHFYSDFYVYKYATGITCAINIANMILEDNSVVTRYKQFLKAGGSMDSLDIIKIMGIDLTKKKPFNVAMEEFVEVYNELEKLSKEVL
ncbi:MAG: oligoendopeptidase F [Clostridia bacterium]